MNSPFNAPVIAVLGPTNTGKTHLAIERMCAHSSGMIGFPLRLLAREVYDRVVAIKGANRVALVTGEEKIIPKDAQWFLCTAESMPTDREFSFVAIDEAQLGIDPERGHIFTDRMLNFRGRDETMILGSESLRGLVQTLIPEAEIITRPRFSTLTYAGPRKLSRLPKRSAIVAFSVEDVYAIAEMLRRQHGGAALVMGSLSPQTRNAQVQMYQDGEVDFLVATDAIGMGLNLDVKHVAFAALKKFDGRRRRRLTLPEIGQIAGRAGRHQTDGSFGVLAGLSSSEALEPEQIEHLENHEFPRLDWLYWRDSEPNMSSVGQLIADLERRPRGSVLRAAPESTDLAVLKRAAQDGAIAASARNCDMVQLLWEACSIPDFRKVGADHQARFVASLWPHLSTGNGRIPHARMAQEISRLENVAGDISVLGARIAAARTWSYIAQKPRWTEQADVMIERTRDLERKLSDAMHTQLTQRFVDKRTRVLMKGLVKDAWAQDVVVEDDGAVLVEGIVIGTLKGFHFAVPSDSRREDRKMLLNAATRFLGKIMTDKADALAKAPDSVLTLVAGTDNAPTVMWGDSKLAVLTKGKTLLTPELKFDPAVKDMSADDAAKVETRVKTWLEAMKAKHLEGLVKIDALASAEDTPPAVRALFAQIVEAGGIIARREVGEAVHALDNELRGVARRAGLVFGALDIFHHALMKPGAVLWRNGLFAALNEAPMMEMPADNAVHLKSNGFAQPENAARLGFRKVATEYVRVDMAERMIKQAHEARSAGPVFAVDDALATSLGLSKEAHQALLEMGGFVKTDDVPMAKNPEKAPEDKELEKAAPKTATPDVKVEEAKPEEKFEAKPANEKVEEAAAEPAPETEKAIEEKPPEPTTYWRWKGMGQAKRAGGKPAHKVKPFKGKKQGGQKPKQRKPEPVLATAGGAFAELAALKESMKK